MNLKLTKKQTAEYIQAILAANNKEETLNAHYQFGQLDEVQKIKDEEKRLHQAYLNAQYYASMSNMQNAYHQNQMAQSQAMNTHHHHVSLELGSYVKIEQPEPEPSIWQKLKTWFKGEQQ